MALLGAVAASGAGGRRGCMLRVAADAITFYCNGAGSGHANGTAATDGSANNVESGGSNYYLRAVGGVVGVATGDDPAVVALDDDGGGGPSPGDYFRPVRSVSMTGYDFNTTAVTVLMNTTASIEPFVNGSNQTLIKETDEDFANYVFVITVGIILGGMILTTICGKSC